MRSLLVHAQVLMSLMVLSCRRSLLKEVAKTSFIVILLRGLGGGFSQFGQARGMHTLIRSQSEWARMESMR